MGSPMDNKRRVPKRCMNLISDADFVDLDG